jgi:hypothetical protein
MLATLLSRLTQPLPSRAHDGLFTTFAPNGVSAATLRALYHQYDDAFADEPVPPQHRYFRSLVDQIAGQKTDASGLQRIRAVYASCFERSEAFEDAVDIWRKEPAFRTALIEAREQIIAELLPTAMAEAARRKHFSRWRECLAAPLDIEGANRLDLIKQMSPDDWHEIVLNWNWDHGTAELDWITARRDCDRATAVVALAAGKCGKHATHTEGAHEWKHAGFVRTLAARMENGFYPIAELKLELSMRKRTQYEAELEMARATNESPWRIPEGLLDWEGVRAHQPKYAVTDGRLHYHYEYWLEHGAPRTR